MISSATCFTIQTAEQKRMSRTLYYLRYRDREGAFEIGSQGTYSALRGMYRTYTTVCTLGRHPTSYHSVAFNLSIFKYYLASTTSSAINNTFDFWLSDMVVYGTVAIRSAFSPSPGTVTMLHVAGLTITLPLRACRSFLVD